MYVHSCGMLFNKGIDCNTKASHVLAFHSKDKVLLGPSDFVFHQYVGGFPGVAALSQSPLRLLRPPDAGRPLQAARRDPGGGHIGRGEGPPLGASLDRETPGNTGRECSRNYDGECRMPERGMCSSEKSSG